jgi:hypothetical protein
VGYAPFLGADGGNGTMVVTFHPGAPEGLGGGGFQRVIARVKAQIPGLSRLDTLLFISYN